MLQGITKIIASGLIPICAATIFNIGGVKAPLSADTVTPSYTPVVTETPEMPSHIVPISGECEDDDAYSDEDFEISEAEEGIETEVEAEEDSYENYAIVIEGSGSINVRDAASTDGTILGHISSGCVCEIIEQIERGDGLWFYIKSGNLEGFVKASFFLYGEEATEIITSKIRTVAVVKSNALFVRAEANKESEVIGSVRENEELELADIVLEEDSEWTAIVLDEDTVGYVASEYVTVTKSYECGKTLEEERAEVAAKSASELRRRTDVDIDEETDMAVVAEFSSLDEIRNALVKYACGFEGIDYIMGGNSLVTGTDCSGFTCLIYAAFGYSIGRIPQTQWDDNGREVSLDELLPGDIICFGRTTDDCYHVAIYIGNGKIVHEANSRRGCIISGIDFEPILGAKRIIE